MATLLSTSDSGQGVSHMESCLNKFASAELSDDTLAMIHGGGGRGSAHSGGGSGRRTTNVVVAPVFNFAIAVNVATQIGGSNAIIQNISIGQWGNVFG